MGCIEERKEGLSPWALGEGGGGNFSRPVKTEYRRAQHKGERVLSPILSLKRRKVSKSFPLRIEGEEERRSGWVANSGKR